MGASGFERVGGSTCSIPPYFGSTNRLMITSPLLLFNSREEPLATSGPRRLSNP